MSTAAIDALDRVTAALTNDEIALVDAATGNTFAEGHGVPLLQRSVGQDVRDLTERMNTSAQDKRLLIRLADCIDEALLAAAEAKSDLERVAQ